MKVTGAEPREPITLLREAVRLLRDGRVILSYCPDGGSSTPLSAGPVIALLEGAADRLEGFTDLFTPDGGGWPPEVVDSVRRSYASQLEIASMVCAGVGSDSGERS